MYLQALEAPQTARDLVDAFGGYDHRTRAPENTFFSMENLTGDEYPLLRQRDLRGVYPLPKKAGEPQALLSGADLVYAAGGKLYVHDRAVMDLNDRGPKKLIAMGAFIIVLPDKVYYNTADPEDKGWIEANTTARAGVKAVLCEANGAALPDPVVSDTQPEEPQNGTLWLDTSVTPNALKIYSAQTGLWTGVASTYVLLQAVGIGKKFKAGDAVKISGLGQFGGTLADVDNTTIILTDVNDDRIVIPGLITETKTSYRDLHFARNMPLMDHVFECGNRLWGCRYGKDEDGNFVNEIYCSKLGDFKNWRCYEGISTDSYAVTVGSDGAFTGGIAYQGNPIFFKENIMYRIYGAYPAAYQLNTINCRGVQAGADRSMTIMNERLYYKARGGVFVFDGSYPSEISDVFGDETFDREGEYGAPAAAGGALNNKYFVSMRGSDGRYNLFVFDSALGAWFREDATQATEFARAGDNLYFIADGRIWSVKKADDADGEERIGWSCTTGAIGLSLPDRKYVSRATVRASLTPGSRIRIFIQHDSCGDYVMLTEIKGTCLRSFSIPIRPRRCDHFRLRFEGEGAVKIFAIAKTIEQGSEL